MRSIFFTLAIAAVTVAQVVYPENETNENRKPQGHNRQPVTSAKCAEGELLYPGDNEGDWACDCKPTFVYYPQTSKCYQVFSRGPCKTREMLVIQPKKVIPVCAINNCGDGKLQFNNVCTTIDSYEACRQPSQSSNSYKLYLNATTLQIYCSFNIPSRFDDDDDEYHDQKECLLGGKRSQEGLCGV